MGYLHIDNLYKNQTVLQFKDVIVMEKVHGTSAHVAFERGQPLRFFRGGVSSQEAFEALFDAGLQARFESLGHDKLTVYGEAYGGKLHNGQHHYGPQLRFVAFDVKHFHADKHVWLDVGSANLTCNALGIPFVWWNLVKCDLATLDALRDQSSQQAFRDTGREGGWSEGIVIKPPQEFVDHRGNRVIAKHKRPDMRETKTPRSVDATAAVNQLIAEAAAEEYVTEMRLTHVLDKVLRGREPTMADTPAVMAAMLEDVLREGEGEVVDSRATRKAVGARAAKLFKAYVQTFPQGW